MKCHIKKMASANPFSKDIQNAIRLSLLLINEGTSTIRKLFDSKINSQFRSLSDALQSKKQIINKYYKGDHANKLPKLITPPQYKQLYPTSSTQATDSSCFDLTLLALLLNIVCGVPPPTSTRSWRHEPAATDDSIAADVIRLRITRNRLYGHVKSIGIQDKEFEIEWNALYEVLLRLGAHKPDLNKWKKSRLEPEILREIEGRLYTLMEHDVADLEAIGKKLIALFESSFEQLDKNLSADLYQVKDFVEGRAEFDDFVAATIFEIVDSLGNKIDDQKLMLKMITHLEGENMAEIKEIRQELLKLSTIQPFLEEQYSKLTVIEQTQAELLEKVEQARTGIQCIQAESASNNPNLTKAKQIFQSNPEAIKILIINDPMPGKNFSVLAKALGMVPFDIILDLDHNSLSRDGIYDDVTKVLGKHRPVHTVTYKEFDKVTENEKDAIAISKRTLWIQSNGCSVKECDPSVDKFGRACIPIANLLSSLLKKIPGKRSLVCTTLLLNNTVLVQIGDLEDAVNKSCEMAYDMMVSEPIFISLACDEVINQGKIKLSSGNIERTFASASENQLAYMFEELFPKGIEKIYSFPGNKGPCFLTSEEMTLITPMMDLYHKDIGQMNFEGLEPDEISEQIAEVRDTYQKGSIITHEALYLDSEGRERIYVKRKSKEILEMEGAIRKFLEVRKQTLPTTTYKYMDVVVVHHDACGGATTCLRHLLYTLKSEYPCIELKHMDQQLCEVLKIINERSNLPLFIIAEGSSFHASEINSLHNRLSNMWIPGILIHSKRVFKQQSHQVSLKQRDKRSSGTSDWKQEYTGFYITSDITAPNELAAFRELYHRGQSKRRARRVFLFGLLAFLKDFTKCDEHIMMCVDDLDIIQKSMLRIVCTIWKYTHLGVKSRLLLRYFKAERSNTGMPLNKEKGIVEILGYANDILVTSNEDFEEVLRPAVDFVADRTLAYLHPEEQGESLKTFTDDILCLIENDGEEKLDSSPLLMAILIQRGDRDKDPETKWSQFISDVEEKYGVDYVEGVLQRVIHLCQHTKIAGHYRTLYARYLMEKLDRPTEAISQIKRALGIQDGDSINNTMESESVFLSAYGRLHELNVRKCFNQVATSKSLKEALLMAESNIQEAIFAFKKAQNATRNTEGRKELHTPVPFWMEASARFLLLSLILQHKCQNNIVQFRRFLQSTDNDFIKECEVEGQEALEKLELLIKLDKVHDDYPAFTFERICDIKFKFLRLGVDRKLASSIEKNSFSLKKAIQLQPDNMAFDIGTLMRLESSPGKPRLRYWADLDKNDLEFIITEIDKRIASSHALARNYQDIVTALIYIRQLGCTAASKGTQGYNLKYALQCTTLWVKKYPKDYEAHFMHGTLTLIAGLERSDLKMFLDGEASLSKCREICETHKSTNSFRKRRFYIGKGSGLEKVIPSKGSLAAEAVGRGKLELFTGRLINDKEIRVQHGTFSKAFKATIPGWVKANSNEVLAQAKQHPLVDLNCIFSHDKIMAFNIELHQTPIDDMLDTV